MAAMVERLRARYGAGPLHLLLMTGALVLAGYTAFMLGFGGLFDPDSWWQSVAVWFLAAAIVHDLVLFPTYALIDRLITGAAAARPAQRPSPVNFVRVPLIASALTLLVFLPGIVQQGSDTHLRATGLTQEPYLARWVALSGVLIAVSAACYLIRRRSLRRRTPRDT